MIEDQDFQLKLKSLEIAANSLLETEGNLKVGKMFKIAKEIYNAAYEEDFHNWKSSWSSKVAKETKKKEILETTKTEEIRHRPEETKPADGLKTCPKCGDHIPQTWMVHNIRSNGQACGHKWQKE